MRRVAYWVRGHRISNLLPWYRGQEGVLEYENELLSQFIRTHMFGSEFAMSLDLHSGFGTIDRLWFPYAYTKENFEYTMEAFALKRKMDQVLPNHVYKFEPQKLSYLTNGDVWDWMFKQHQAQYGESIYLPLTLEMGSWAWIKKNPKQVLSFLGPFNPILPHRKRRIP